MPTDEKVRIALELERATKAADPRIRGVESAGYGDALAEAAVANSLGVEAAHAAHDVLGVVGRDGRRRHGHADRLRLRRRPHARRARPRVDPARRRRPRACACSAPSRSPGRRIPVVLDPLVTRSVLGVLSSAFNGEAVLKGRSLFAGREGEEIARADRHSWSTTRPIRARSAPPTHDGEGVPTRPQRR